MFIIFVKREWLSEVGTLPNHLRVVPQKDAPADANQCLVASKIEWEHPFLRAELERAKEGKGGDKFLTSFIPLDVVRGMFQLSQHERTMIGF